MRKILLLFLLLPVILGACVSTNLETYADVDMRSKNIYVALDTQTTSVSDGAFGVPIGSMMAFFSSSETVRLGTIRNEERVKRELSAKGYRVVGTREEADVVLVGENVSNADYTRVTLGFRDVHTGDLLILCEGTYGLGWSMQADVDHALGKAMESIPRL